MVAQIFSVIIFLVMFLMIVLEVFERHTVTLMCGLCTLVIVFCFCMHDFGAIVDTLNIQSIFTLDFWHTSGSANESSGINWATIIFIAGMMIMVEGMARSGFFRWLCMKLAKLVRYKMVPVFLVFITMSFVLSMFIDSITVILFLAAATIELAKLLRFNPVPMLLAEIFCANLGGSATMCGDPPNIIIGTSLGYSFFDFLTNTGLISLISFAVLIPYFLLVFRKDLKSEATEQDIANMPEPSSAIVNKKDFIISCCIFFIAVILLVTHANTGLTVAFIGVFVSVLTLIAAGRNIPELMKRFDYKTLLFFIGLFVVVGGLEQTGVLEIVAQFIERISGGNPKLMVAIIIWLSAFTSAFVDNIPFAATMLPVIKTLSATAGVDLATLAWALSMGTDIGGNATPIGASANVVGTAAAAKAGHPVSWGKYCKFAVPATILVLIISTVYIFVVYL